MNRPVVIVHPFSSGTELAPAFKKEGVPAIAISVKPIERIGYGTKIQVNDFIEVIPEQENLVEILRKYNPLAVIAGSDSGVLLAESLSESLTPQFANDPQKSLHRVHKAFMQEALKEAGVPSLATINTASEIEVENWIKENDLVNSSLIVKPPLSAGSYNVFHIPIKGDWKGHFRKILSEVSTITGKQSETVLVQEEAIGPEFAIGTVSANGKHYLSHIIKYNKASLHGRKTIFDHVEFSPYLEDVHGELIHYTNKVLDALGIHWGAAHNEVILTNKGPRLIETGARMCGGPVVHFSREATGCSQADRLVEIYTKGDVLTKDYSFKKTVVPIFLRSLQHGRVSNVEALSEISKLPTLFREFIWFKNGDTLAQTVDYITSIGIVALSGEREAIFSDYKKIREMEKKLIIE